MCWMLSFIYFYLFFIERMQKIKYWGIDWDEKKIICISM